MRKSTSTNVRKVVAYILSILVLLFSVVAVLAIWDLIDYEYLIRRMFQSLMVVLAASAVIVLIFAILARPEKKED
jgi:hypothetical protein